MTQTPQTELNAGPEAGPEDRSADGPDMELECHLGGISSPLRHASGGDWFALSDVREKIRHLPIALSEMERLTSCRTEFNLGRDVKVVSPSELPRKPGLSLPIGQARLLHDLASIELQAMELAVRTFAEFPDAPREFRSELADIALGEARHLELCLNGIEALGFQWGAWDVHSSLWNAVAAEDSLLDRILIVHRYLEGSGLDAGESILRRLLGSSSNSGGAREVVELIVTEEVDHVLFGSRWYRKIAEQSKVDPEALFRTRIEAIAKLVPRREKLARDLRLRAGFSETELAELERCQTLFSCTPGSSRPEVATSTI